MFNTLRLGSQVYILLKPSDLKIGTVTSVNLPNLYMLYIPNQTIDIKVNIEGSSTEFKQLPSNLGITYYDNGKTIISDNKESISYEILNMIKESNEIINSIPYHKEVIESGQRLLEKLNPEVALSRKQEEKISKLENQVGNMESKLDNIANLLNKAINNDFKNN